MLFSEEKNKIAAGGLTEHFWTLVVEQNRFVKTLRNNTIKCIARILKHSTSFWGPGTLNYEFYVKVQES